jgi:hypothetical protein
MREPEVVRGEQVTLMTRFWWTCPAVLVLLGATETPAYAAVYGRGHLASDRFRGEGRSSRQTNPDLGFVVRQLWQRPDWTADQDVNHWCHLAGVRHSRDREGGSRVAHSRVRLFHVRSVRPLHSDRDL